MNKKAKKFKEKGNALTSTNLRNFKIIRGKRRRFSPITTNLKLAAMKANQIEAKIQNTGDDQRLLQLLENIHFTIRHEAIK